MSQDPHESKDNTLRTAVIEQMLYPVGSGKPLTDFKL